MWGNCWKEYGAIIAVGDDAKLARNDLERVFGNKLDMACDPTTSIGCGLYKFAALQAKLTDKKHVSVSE